MNRRMLFLAIAAVSGLAAQTVTSSITAAVPFPFDFQGTAMAAGQYEVVRTTLPNTLSVRNLATGATVRMMTASTSQTADAANALVFEKAGGGYYFRAMLDARTALAYNVSRTRKQVEQASNTTPERVYIAAR
jgi:hypothetical protein